MPQQTLQDIFKDFVNRANGIFKDRDVLSSDYIPEIMPHRDKETKHLGTMVAPLLVGAKGSNIFIYGKTGTGKTLVVKHVISELEKSGARVRPLYINCKMKRVSDTEYRLLAELSRSLGRRVPATGLPTEEIYRIFYDTVQGLGKNILLVLDEIDALVKKIGDDILYNLTRANQDLSNTKISIIGISNDVSFIDGLDPRVRSSLSEEEVIFPPYNATQLKDILEQRAGVALNPGALGAGVISKCAALAAQEHGDARKALDLLRIAGELSERNHADKVTVDHVDNAEDKLDLDKYVEIVRSQPKQSKAVLAATIRLAETGQKDIQTGDIFTLYERICSSSGLKVLTQRRVSGLIAELDMEGIINTRVISKGRYGRTREIRILLSQPVLGKIKGILQDSRLL